MSKRDCAASSGVKGRLRDGKDKAQRANSRGGLLSPILSVIVLVTALFASNGSIAKNADLVVYGDYVVPMEDDEAVIEDGAVAIIDGKIVAVGKRDEIDRDYPSVQQISGLGKILLPGLINGHTHTAMTLFRGMVDDLNLMTWLNDYVFPMEGRFVNQEFIRVGSNLACYEMIKSGTTSFVDMYFYPDEIAKVVEKCGLRAVIAAPHIDYPSPGFSGWDDSFAAAKKFVADWQGRNPRITPAFAPHAPYTVSPQHLRDTVEAADELNAPISMHLAEAPAESEFIAKNYQVTPVEHAQKQGILNSRLIAAHMVQLSSSDIAKTAKAGVGAIHNPTSNMKLGAGISPVVAMLDAGVNVGLGTDGAASNNDLDMFEEIRMAALLHKVATGDPTAMPAGRALAMATRTGARAVGMSAQVGQLKVGLQADMIQVDYSGLERQPIYDVISHLVYSIDSSDVTTTIVAGKVLMRDKQVLSLDEHALQLQVAKKAKLIADVLNGETPE